MRTYRRWLAPALVGFLLLAPLTACGDEEGEDVIGDGEIND